MTYTSFDFFNQTIKVNVQIRIDNEILNLRFKYIKSVFNLLASTVHAQNFVNVFMNL